MTPDWWIMCWTRSFQCFNTAKDAVVPSIQIFAYRSEDVRNVFMYLQKVWLISTPFHDIAEPWQKNCSVEVKSFSRWSDKHSHHRGFQHAVSWMSISLCTMWKDLLRIKLGHLETNDWVDFKSVRPDHTNSDWPTYGRKSCWKLFHCGHSYKKENLKFESIPSELFWLWFS